MNLMPSPALAALEAEVGPLLSRLGNHPLFDAIRTLEDVRCFMAHHVFAVWDFMCLLKALQNAVTCTRVPWIPVGDARVRRLINEICLDEESDELDDGRCFSHLELYLEAMKQAGANIDVPSAFVEVFRHGGSIEEALTLSGVPVASREFVEQTMSVIETRSPHRIAAAFTLGREEAIPRMFAPIVRTIGKRHPSLGILQQYLERHIELDGDKHGPLGKLMLAGLCGSDERAWIEATESAVLALNARSRLWDGVLSAIGMP